MGNLNHQAVSCPICAGSIVTETFEIEEFPVGDKEPVTASALVPVLTCSACSFAFTDARAEPLRHDAACSALGLLTPGEIRAVRSLYNMNRREFAAAFHIGHASLERWENRKLMIGGQSNFYVRALADPQVGLRLLGAAAAKKPIEAETAETNVIRVDFTALKSSPAKLLAAVDRQKRFSLQKAGR